MRSIASLPACGIAGEVNRLLSSRTRVVVTTPSMRPL